MYNVPRTTAKRRAAGTVLKYGFIVLNYRLTLAEKESLKQWILLID